MPTNEQKLYKVYYEDANFFGRDKLFEITQSKGLNIPRKELETWLRAQYLYQLTKPLNPSTRGTRSMVAKDPFNIMATDLSSSGDFIFLVLIDVFSRMAFVEIVDNKSAEEVKKGIQKILNKLPKKPKTILSDNGTEFKNQILSNFLQNEGIKQLFSIAGNPQSNSIVERFNGTVKPAIRKAGMIDDDIDQRTIDKIVNNYNNSKHSSLDMSPKQALKPENKDFVRTTLRQNRVLNLSQDKDNLEKGDLVRKALAPNKIQKLPINWSMDLYKVIDVRRPKQDTQPIAYRIQNTETGKVEKGFFGRSLLQKIIRVDNKDKVDVRFKVDRILDRFKQGNQWVLKVSWKGFPVSEATIEPEKNIKEDLKPAEFRKLMKDFRERNR